jgi:outer membrane protein insertion porin family
MPLGFETLHRITIHSGKNVRSGITLGGIVSRKVVLCVGVFVLQATMISSSVNAQFGGGMSPGGGAPMSDAMEKPKFRDFIHNNDALTVRREKGDAVVAEVKVVGNEVISSHRIHQKLQTRKNRFYDYETVLSDVRRLNDMGSFDHVTFNIEEGKKGVSVTFTVHERPTVSKVVYHGNRGLNDRELSGRAGINANDPLNEFSIESSRRRLLDYYREEGFNQVSITSQIGDEQDDRLVLFRINEGPKERIEGITIEGNTVVSEARLLKIISSRGPLFGVVGYVNNVADLRKIDQDVNFLAGYYHNLGFLTATVGRRLEYDESGKWLTVHFVINEGPRFQINDIKIVGNEFVTEESLRARLELHSGDMFNGTVMRRDVGELVYGYGELGFIYAEVEPKTVMRDEANTVDLIYEVSEGDRWKVGQIRVNIEGEPHLMRETTMLNLVDLREGDWIDRRTLELNRKRIERSQLLETNPMIADPPDIKVVPHDDYLNTL